MARSTVSDTDLKLFLNLSNPETTNKDEPRPEDDDDDDVDGAEDEDDEGDEEGEGEEDDEEGDEEDDEEDEGGDEEDGAGGRAPAMSREEMDYAKTAVLLELERLRGLGCRLTREYTMENATLEEMEYEARKHVLFLEEKNMVATMKDGLRLFVSGAELANRKFGPFLNLDGFSQSVGNDLTAGKYNLTLSKLHRKYFKTPGTSSPEMDLAFGILSSMAMFHFQRTYVNKLMPGGGGGAGGMSEFPPLADDDSDDDGEDLPPAFH